MMRATAAAAAMVAALIAPAHAGAAQTPTITVATAHDTARPLVGEAVPITLTLVTPDGEPARLLRSITLQGDATGVVLRPDSIKADGPAGGRVTVEIVPLRPGRQSVAFVVGLTRRDDRRRAIEEVTTAPLALRVESAPETGRPADYQGAVGDFRFGEPRLTGDTTRAGAVLSLEIDLHGRGAIERVAAPALRSPDWWITAEPAMTVTGDDGARIRRFRWSLLAARGGELATPSGALTLLDPTTRQYRTLTAPTMRVRLPGPVAEPNRDTGRLTPVTRDELTPVTRSAPFLTLNLLAFAALGLVLGRDRARRLDLADPRRVTRRLALIRFKRIRRDYAKAVAAGDFTAADRLAADALRTATAPGLDARPEALSAGDILAVLEAPEDERVAATALLTGESLRRYAPPHANSATPTHPAAMRRLLSRLERRLR